MTGSRSPEEGRPQLQHRDGHPVNSYVDWMSDRDAVPACNGAANCAPMTRRQDAPNRTATIRLRGAWNILSDSTFRGDHVHVRPMGPLPTRQAPAKSPVAVISVRSHATRGAAPHDSFGVDTAVWWPILVCLVHR